MAKVQYLLSQPIDLSTLSKYANQIVSLGYETTFASSSEHAAEASEQ
jgi:hypothetical protein